MDIDGNARMDKIFAYFEQVQGSIPYLFSWCHQHLDHLVVTKCSFVITWSRWWSKSTWGSTCSSCMVIVMLKLRSSRCLCCYIESLNWINSNQYSKTCQHESLEGVFNVTYRLLNRSWSTWWLIATLVTLKWNWVWYLKDPWKSYGFPWLPLISLPMGNVVVAWLVCFTSCFLT